MTSPGICPWFEVKAQVLAGGRGLGHFKEGRIMGIHWLSHGYSCFFMEIHGSSWIFMDIPGYSLQMFVDEKGCFFGPCWTKGAHDTHGFRWRSASSWRRTTSREVCTLCPRTRSKRWPRRCWAKRHLDPLGRLYPVVKHRKTIGKP